MKGKVLDFIVIIMFFGNILNAQSDSSKVKKIVKKIDISGTWYLAYNKNITDSTNQFLLKRGYITFKSKLNSNLSIRYTQDITLDTEGSDAGNIEIRMKYLYLKLKPFQKGFFKNSFAEFGLVHRPFVDFEQKINTYRSQGKMFIEKSGIVNTSDFGFSFNGLIGEKLSSETQKKVGSHYPGKYGSYSIGIYNGGGYHAIEKNNNKTIEGRLTIRPLPEFIPGLQFSYGGILGKGNKDDITKKFIMSLFAVTYEDKHFILSGQYYTGQGDYKGKYIDIKMNAAKNDGYSVFGELKIPKTSFALFGRYDNFVSKQELNFSKTYYFGGVTYRFLKNKVFAYYGNELIAGKKEEVFELVLEVVF